MLKENLYRIKSSEQGDVGFLHRIELLPESVIYKAHFPGMPITPGVCIIALAGELFAESAGIPMEIAKVKNAKFLVPLVPDGSEKQVSVSKIKQEGDLYSSQITITDTTGVTYAKISLQTKAA